MTLSPPRLLRRSLPLFLLAGSVAAVGLSAAFAADTPELVKPAAPSANGVAPGAPSDIKWKKIKLSNKFFCEGASFGDFNHDGKMDIVSGPYWYEGPDFSPEKRRTYSTDTKPYDPKEYSKNFFAFTYDFNGDGWDDILIYGFPGEDASWYQNPGPQSNEKDAPWARHKVLDVVDNESPTFTDIDGDGRPDIVCNNGGYLGYATADWKDPAKPWTFHKISEKKGWQRFTHGLGYGDVNGDGKPDLLLHEGWWEQPASLQGDPEWKFHKADFGPGGAQMYVYDVNGDGKNDVITSLQAHGYGLAWFEQKSDGNFERHLIIGDKPEQNPYGVKFSQLHAVDLIDIDGDGLKDIVTGKRYWAHGAAGDQEPGAPAVVYWFQLVRKTGPDGAKTAEFVPHLIDDDSGVGTQVVAGDVNGDKRPDIVVGNKKGTFVLLQQGK
jgi:hypothetical protein